MGLDWIPFGRPRPGAKAEFYAGLGALTSPENWPAGTPIPFSPSGGEDAAWGRLAASEITPYETLGAPRVGRDPAADAWVRGRYATARDRPPTVEEWVQKFEGFWVLDLLPDNDGLPIYCNAPWGGVERFSFRGKFLDDCADVIGGSLHREAHLNHLPDQLARYGRALMEAAEVHARARGVAEVLDRRALDDEASRADTPRSRAMWQVHIAASAARWALWWSSRGHGLHADW